MIKVLSAQSLLDIGVQEAGSAEAVFLLAAENNLSIMDSLEAGQELETVQATDKDVFNYYQNNNLKPATGLTGSGGGSGSGGSDELEEGIEFWYVEYDFVVS